ncbi:MAG: 3-keto-5-aminohexanoate cleavage protein [Clostridiales Family XIII bacterium]|nr:3-keto-5-aminohexanoate cleavage protein [Clostridiales Family XIII bacterium]
MASAEKLIITAAICGGEVTRAHNPAVPYTVEETVREAACAYQAGASIIHLHVRQDDGTPTMDLERFRAVMEGIRAASPDVIILPTTGGTIGMTNEERLTPTLLNPEMASLNPGSCNFGDEVYANSIPDVKVFCERFLERGIVPECEVFDKGHIDTTIALAREGYIKEPVHFNIVLGVVGAAAADVRTLAFFVDTLPPGSTWCATGIGRAQFPLAAAAIQMGGHIRVGFEDNVYLEKGVLAPGNAALVEKAVGLARAVGRPVATPAEAREILGLSTKGNL